MVVGIYTENMSSLNHEKPETQIKQSDFSRKTSNIIYFVIKYYHHHQCPEAYLSLLTMCGKPMSLIFL